VPAGPIPDPAEVHARYFPPRSALREWALPSLLFLATLLTTLSAGGRLAIGDQSWSAQLAHGIPFAIPLLLILLSHEMGHFIAAKIHRVSASPPYFIPFPSFFGWVPSLVGTLGAVIRMRGRVPSRRALIDIGAAGPIAGFLVALPLLVWGLLHSTVHATIVPQAGLPPTSPLAWILRWVSGQQVSPMPVGVIQEGTSLLYAAAVRVVAGRIPPGQDIFIHPTAFAAWFGLLVTTLNLIPIGQFDGGHIAFAMLGRRAQTVGRVFVGILVVLGLTAWIGWLLWAFFGWLLVGTAHPPVEDPEDQLDPVRRAVGWISLAIFLVTFMPVPLAIY
jgi:membrane-associated protease RseP (regulator of RpoE activity)